MNNLYVNVTAKGSPSGTATTTIVTYKKRHNQVKIKNMTVFIYINPKN